MATNYSNGMGFSQHLPKPVIQTIKDLEEHYPNLDLITLSQDVKAIKQELGIASLSYGGFFIQRSAATDEIILCYGFYGNIPYNSKTVEQVA